MKQWTAQSVAINNKSSTIDTYCSHCKRELKWGIWRRAMWHLFEFYQQHLSFIGGVCLKQQWYVLEMITSRQTRPDWSWGQDLNVREDTKGRSRMRRALNMEIGSLVLIQTMLCLHFIILQTLLLPYPLLLTWYCNNELNYILCLH